MKNVPEIFGSLVFNDNTMREMLPKYTYGEFKRIIAEGLPLELEMANIIAHSMKLWAIEKGATHFTHWFQPMTGITAEKHDSFISPLSGGGVIMEFSGKELVKGEPDASSFPSGGLRTTFEARGYTAWDPTSYAFIKDRTLCIPTAFCSYGGHALDKKTPLLRSMDAVEKQALRILRLFGDNETKKVTATVGAEQEYFLVDKDVYDKRPDLVNCGRTLLGARAPKGQEFCDHYFGAIKPRVSSFMQELDEELWKLGISAKTKHNEVAPAQHELAPVFTTANIASDHNQLTMELMKTIANKHNLACLLHERPFEGVNGSGKHNNWSLCTDSGVNLFEPGDTPSKNEQFLLFIAAVVKAADEHQDLLRLSVASAGNDHRLGANEAPPAVVSVFLGDEITDILNSILRDEECKSRERLKIKIGKALARIPKDASDRNRTSPLAFTGNKFEFRMLGSSFSISGSNIIINTTIAEALSEFADTLEAAEDFHESLSTLLKEQIEKHGRIIYNGNNYSAEWVEEAERRGLLNMKTSAEALQHLADDKNIQLFKKHKVFREDELRARQDILLEEYCKIINLEALTFIDIINRDVLPYVFRYQAELANLALTKKELGADLQTEKLFIDRMSELCRQLKDKTDTLAASSAKALVIASFKERAEFCCREILTVMKQARTFSDELESVVSRECWKLPTYSDILYSVD